MALPNAGCQPELVSVRAVLPQHTVSATNIHGAPYSAAWIRLSYSSTAVASSSIQGLSLQLGRCWGQWGEHRALPQPAVDSGS